MQVRLAKLSTHVKILSGFCAQKWVLFQGFLLMSLVDDGLVAMFVQKTMRCSIMARCTNIFTAIAKCVVPCNSGTGKVFSKNVYPNI